MIGSLKDLSVSEKFTKLPLSNKSKVGVEENTSSKWEMVKSLKLIGEVVGF